MSQTAHQPASDSPLASLAGVTQAVWRHKRLWVAVFMGVAACVALATWLTPREYRSQAKLFLRLGRENSAVEPLTAVGHDRLFALPPSREEEVNSVMELIASHQVVGEVVDELGAVYVVGSGVSATDAESTTAGKTTDIRLASANLSSADTAQDPSDFLSTKDATDHILSPGSSARDKAVRHALRNLIVSAERKSLIITVEYDGQSPSASRTILQSILDTYVQLHTNMHRVQGAYEFLKSHADDHRQRLLEAEEELSQLRNTTGLASIDEQRSLMLAQLSGLKDQLMGSQVELSARRQGVASLENAISVVPATRLAETTTGVANEGFDGMRQRLFDLEIQEKKDSSIYADDHFQLKNIRREIKELRDFLKIQPSDRTEQKTALNKNHEDLQMSLLLERKEFSVLEAREATLLSQIASIEKQVTALNVNSLRIKRLERDVVLLETAYRQYAENLEQARMDENIRQRQLSNISIAQAPTVPARPVRPNLLLNSLLGLLAAGTFATSAVWMRDRRAP